MVNTLPPVVWINPCDSEGRRCSLILYGPFFMIMNYICKGKGDARIGISEWSARWMKLAVNSVREGEDSLVISNRNCPRIKVSLNSPSKELEWVRLSRMKTEFSQSELAGVRRTDFWPAQASCIPADNCVFVTAGNRKNISSKALPRRILLFAIDIIFLIISDFGEWRDTLPTKPMSKGYTANYRDTSINFLIILHRFAE